MPDLRGLDDFLLGHAEREIQIHPIGQRANFPFVCIVFGRGELLDFLDDDFLHDVHQPIADIRRRG